MLTAAVGGVAALVTVATVAIMQALVARTAAWNVRILDARVTVKLRVSG